MRLYIDSNVLISYYKQEFGSLTQFQSERTKQLLSLCGALGYTLVLSDLTFKEIKRIAYASQEEVEMDLESCKIDFDIIGVSQRVLQRSKEIENAVGIHYPDSMHVALAVESKSDAIITWNKKDFDKACDFIASYTPEDIITTLSP